MPASPDNRPASHQSGQGSARARHTKEGWKPGGYINGGLCDHIVQSDAIYQASSGTLAKAGKHLATVKRIEAESQQWSRARFQKSRDAAKLWEDVHEIFDEVHTGQLQSPGGMQTTGAFECYSASSTLTQSTRRRQGEQGAGGPPRSARLGT